MAACSARELESALEVFSWIEEPARAVDDLFDEGSEYVRHILLEAWVEAKECGPEMVAPILDLLTSLKYRSKDPIKTAVPLGGFSSFRVCLEEKLHHVRTLQDRSATPVQAVPEQERRREDFPKRPTLQRASMQLALEAAQPANLVRTLAALDADVLASSTASSNACRVRLYESICCIAEVEAWPVSQRSARIFAGCLKQGRYRSIKIYFSAVLGHQLRVLETVAPPDVQRCITDATRSALRGAGPSQLKEHFHVPVLRKLLQREAGQDGFTPSNPDHWADVMLICAWWMFREVESSAAQVSHVAMNPAAQEVTIMLPVQKTDSRGMLCCRTLKCACRAAFQDLCPYHAMKRKRHLLRLPNGGRETVWSRAPLFLGEDGSVISKDSFVRHVRDTLQACDVEVTKEYEDSWKMVLPYDSQAGAQGTWVLEDSDDPDAHRPEGASFDMGLPDIAPPSREETGRLAGPAVGPSDLQGRSAPKAAADEVWSCAVTGATTVQVRCSGMLGVELTALDPSTVRISCLSRRLPPKEVAVVANLRSFLSSLSSSAGGPKVGEPGHGDASGQLLRFRPGELAKRLSSLWLYLRLYALLLKVYLLHPNQGPGPWKLREVTSAQGEPQRWVRLELQLPAANATACLDLMSEAESSTERREKRRRLNEGLSIRFSCRASRQAGSEQVEDLRSFEAFFARYLADAIRKQDDNATAMQPNWERLRTSRLYPLLQLLCAPQRWMLRETSRLLPPLRRATLSRNGAAEGIVQSAWQPVVERFSLRNLEQVPQRWQLHFTLEAPPQQCAVMLSTMLKRGSGSASDEVEGWESVLVDGQALSEFVRAAKSASGPSGAGLKAWSVAAALKPPYFLNELLAALLDILSIIHPKAQLSNGMGRRRRYGEDGTEGGGMGDNTGRRRDRRDGKSEGGTAGKGRDGGDGIRRGWDGDEEKGGDGRDKKNRNEEDGRGARRKRWEGGNGREGMGVEETGRRG
ncbi:hypothetical protein AK812_SmicGene12636 [Symbiodinium microadriaticum]|uniref:Uncharacterized protein n=1 Tax=Symbiodinium microadriaticum TaxID=2951 RepID=A0A1Q9EAA9_SYMMI|nr:hypothetical protein AK812_SmicGene12636 [Symbiodinium microadriaticum]